jgi:hypothetical protein
MVALARDHGITTVFVPAVDAAEAALVEGMTIIPMGSLAALVRHLRGLCRGSLSVSPRQWTRPWPAPILPVCGTWK